MLPSQGLRSACVQLMKSAAMFDSNTLNVILRRTSPTYVFPPPQSNPRSYSCSRSASDTASSPLFTGSPPQRQTDSLPPAPPAVMEHSPTAEGEDEDDQSEEEMIGGDEQAEEEVGGTEHGEEEVGGNDQGEDEVGATEQADDVCEVAFAEENNESVEQSGCLDGDGYSSSYSTDGGEPGQYAYKLREQGEREVEEEDNQEDEASCSTNSTDDDEDEEIGCVLGSVGNEGQSSLSRTESFVEVRREDEGEEERLIRKERPGLEADQREEGLEVDQRKEVLGLDADQREEGLEAYQREEGLEADQKKEGLGLEAEEEEEEEEEEVGDEVLEGEGVERWHGPGSEKEKQVNIEEAEEESDVGEDVAVLLNGNEKEGDLLVEGNGEFVEECTGKGEEGRVRMGDEGRVRMGEEKHAEGRETMREPGIVVLTGSGFMNRSLSDSGQRSFDDSVPSNPAHPSLPEMDESDAFTSNMSLAKGGMSGVAICEMKLCNTEADLSCRRLQEYSPNLTDATCQSQHDINNIEIISQYSSHHSPSLPASFSSEPPPPSFQNASALQFARTSGPPPTFSRVSTSTLRQHNSVQRTRSLCKSAPYLPVSLTVGGQPGGEADGVSRGERAGVRPSSCHLYSNADDFAVVRGSRLYGGRGGGGDSAHPHNNSPLTSACRRAVAGKMFRGGSQQPMAEALWNHVTMDPLELVFNAGDVIQVCDMLDADWWRGRTADQREGWFPASFVVLQRTDPPSPPTLPLPPTAPVNIDQGEGEAGMDYDREEEAQAREGAVCDEGIRDVVVGCSGTVKSPDRGRSSVQERSRSNIVMEMLNSEKDYVKHLRDVIEGYVSKARLRSDMFTAERISIIFGNIEQLHTFSVDFLNDLEQSVKVEAPHRSELGHCFLKWQKHFDIYSEYCNNYPEACEEMRRLQNNRKYQQFFEACRLLQGMVEIPLDGFLLTPIQKICKYPLQIKELLRFTSPQHGDYPSLCMALDVMRHTALIINERKRKMESFEELVLWQDSVTGWQGADLLESSSELIYSGDLSKLSSGGGWLLDRVVFLFDHQLIYCKKDLLGRDTLIYKDRIDLDVTTVHRIQPDSGQSGSVSGPVRYGFKLCCNRSNSTNTTSTVRTNITGIVPTGTTSTVPPGSGEAVRWYSFGCRSQAEEDRWFRAFADERCRVNLDLDLAAHDLDRYRQRVIEAHAAAQRGGGGGSVRAGLQRNSRRKDKSSRLKKDGSVVSDTNVFPVSASSSDIGCDLSTNQRSARISSPAPPTPTQRDPSVNNRQHLQSHPPQHPTAHTSSRKKNSFLSFIHRKR